MVKIQPFSHPHKQILNVWLAEARKIFSKKESSSTEKLSGILIFSNQVEYICKQLLHSFSWANKKIVYSNCDGIFFPIEKDYTNSKETLGALVAELKKYNFPDRESFIDKLEKFNEKRNLVIHKLLDNEKIKDDESEIIKKMFDEIFSTQIVINKAVSKKMEELQFIKQKEDE
jgi:hypothetical protein